MLSVVATNNGKKVLISMVPEELFRAWRPGVNVIKLFFSSVTHFQEKLSWGPAGNTKGGSITEQLTPCLTGLESAGRHWQFLFSFAKQTNPSQSNRRSMPFSIPWALVSLSWLLKKITCKATRVGSGFTGKY